MTAGVAVMVVLGAGVVAGWRAGVFSAAGSVEPEGSGVVASTAAVVRGNVAATTPVAGVLGYAGTYVVTGGGGGALTWLPPPGRVIGQGQVLYKTGNGSPVVLLYGSVPAWRALGEGVTGADVSQLNRDLVALGDAGQATVAAAGQDYFSWATAYGVQRLEERLGVSFPPGSLALGQVVFEPGAVRVDRAIASLGSQAAGPVLAATTDRRVVTVALDASQESEVSAGDKVTVTLPDGTVTPGTVSSVGRVATITPASQQGQGPAATIPVQVKLTDSAAAGSLDQAPVTVNITTAIARDVLAVPVTALLARSPDGYVVEVVGQGKPRRFVPVTLGIFDDASGMVQVAGALVPGQRVVVASS